MSAPVFNHRLEGDIADSLGLTDSISMMAYRAKGILTLASINMDSASQASDEIVKAAIDAVIAEVEDIDATIQAWHQALVQGGAA